MLLTWSSLFTINNACNVQSACLCPVTVAVLKLDYISLYEAKLLRFGGQVPKECVVMFTNSRRNGLNMFRLDTPLQKLISAALVS